MRAPGTRPHVCFVAPTAWPILSGDSANDFAGGAEVQQSLLAKRLARRGYRVSMICMDYGQPDPVTVDGVTVTTCHDQGGGIPVIRFFHPRLTGLWSALRRANADIYYQRAAGAATGVVGLFARCYGRRFVYAAAHDLDLARDETWKAFRRRAGWRDRQLYYLGLSLADAIVAQTPRQERDCLRWYKRDARLIRSGYDGAETTPADPEGVVLWVSMMRSWKRPEMFLELARRLPHRRFRMVGGRSSEHGGAEAFERIEAAAAHIPNLEFVGFVPHPEIEAQFAGVRLFVNTSEGEGFPNTFLQAWSRGIPAVSVVDTGSVVDRRPVVNVVSDLDEMTARVETLMSDDVCWRRSGLTSRMCFEQFHSIDSVLSSYERLFDDLASPFSNAVAPAAAERC
ncbi:MAG TPA: glycosyltransferase family 4 protein [Vicinamibacterales bacterium]|nr:glycosyltransferase family 4 protein [Vicinamibacterales bacterium]